MPETFAPKILMSRARELRKTSGNLDLYTTHEKRLQESDFKRTLVATLKRVPMLLIFEPMLLLLCIWSALLLGILYLLFEAFPIVFGENHGFTTWQTGLAFLGQAIGLIGALCTVPWWAKVYRRAALANGGAAPPEARLPMCKLGAFLTTSGLFIFAFTSYPHVHWIAPIIGTIPFGAGVLLVYTGVFSYTTSAWLPVAASAMSANSLVRSIWAAAFPLFSTQVSWRIDAAQGNSAANSSIWESDTDFFFLPPHQMYHKLGTVGASALLAGLNVLMIPIPFLLYRYGSRIRSHSRFTF